MSFFRSKGQGARGKGQEESSTPIIYKYANLQPLTSNL